MFLAYCSARRETLMSGRKMTLCGVFALALMACTGSTDKAKDTIVSKTKVVAQAPSKAPELVELSPAAASKLVHAGQSSELLVRVRIAVGAIEDVKRPPMNLALVVDTSASMQGEAIAHARKASLTLLDSLSMGDRLSVITFSSTTEVLLDAVVLNEKSVAEARRKLEAMTANGSTDMKGGLSRGLAPLQKHHTQQGVNRVVLVGDGVPNNSTGLHQLARSAAQRGVSITTLGLGLDYDETMMSTIAQLSGGKFHFVRDAEKVASVFKDEVLRINRTVGRAARLTLAPGPGVSIAEVIGNKATRRGRAMDVQVGDLSEGESRDVVVRVTFPARNVGSVVELLDAFLDYQDAVLGAGGVRERTFVAVKASDDQQKIDESRQADVERSAARVKVAAMTLEAISVARAGKLERARKILDAAEKLARERAAALDDDELLQKAKEMEALRASLVALVAQPVPVPRAVLRPDRVSAPAPSAAPQPVPPGAAEMVRERHQSAVETIQGG